MSLADLPASAAISDGPKTLRKRATDAWVTGTHAERAKTNTLEQRFSAASSGGRPAM
jgi:hypothetical protein